MLAWRQERGRSDGGLIEVAEKLGVHHESVRNWVNRHQVDAGKRPGLTTEKRDELKSLRRENKELRRANEILK